ncbi:hypothetical protein EYF80_046462 [Liparis tanakae]|uniref:Uncharacterized protein n=1 Tax=Liparis tanakae TaxID=230148 RepID=A0A4Z2FQ21_9TELE|nr:hypothetical protein EYF80_046462 [Liparis tanakae]
MKSSLLSRPMSADEDPLYIKPERTAPWMGKGERQHVDRSGGGAGAGAGAGSSPPCVTRIMCVRYGNECRASAVRHRSVL